MSESPEKKKPGRKPETFKIEATFEHALEAALRAPSPPRPKKRKTKKRKPPQD